MFHFVVAARVAEERQHNVLGHEVEVQLVSAAPITKPLVPPQVIATCTILVKGLKDCHNESALRLFFTNKKKCAGGDITNVVIKKEIAYVTFADQKGRLLNIKNYNNCKHISIVYGRNYKYIVCGD